MAIRILLLVLAAALPAGAFAAGRDAPASKPPQAGLPTMEQVVVAPPRGAVVEVRCDKAMWPTQRQVARHLELDAADAERLRLQIVSAGRHACWQGATHVLVSFRTPEREVAVAARD